MSDPHTADLFAPPAGEPQVLAPGAVLLPGAALDDAPALLAAIRDVLARAPLRQMVTRGGFKMSVAMSNCGALGWISDRRGYRYAPLDPERDAPWPAMPPVLQALATTSATRAGFAGFAISETYFYPVDPAKAPTPPRLADATQVAQQVTRIVIEGDGRVSACEGMQYTGVASPDHDACQFVKGQKFEPATGGTAQAMIAIQSGTVVTMTAAAPEGTVC